MRCLLLLLITTFVSTIDAQSGQGQERLEKFAQSIEGAFDNFQQTWQENTKEDLHRVEAKAKHLHLHTRISRLPLEDSKDYFFLLEHTEGRGDKKLLGREVWQLRIDDAGEQMRTEVYLLKMDAPTVSSIKELGTPTEKWYWKDTDDGLAAFGTEAQAVCRLEKEVMTLHRPSGLFAHDAGAYRLHKCRFFSGWIQYPLPNIPDSTYMMRNLKIHDQGGMVQLVLGDGQAVDCTVELTQLVYGKRIAIMKLALYEMPLSEVSYNSRSVSYAWASPDAKRLGINIRKIVSGWTLIEPDYLNANNMNKR